MPICVWAIPDEIDPADITALASVLLLEPQSPGDIDMGPASNPLFPAKEVEESNMSRFSSTIGTAIMAAHFQTSFVDLEVPFGVGQPEVLQAIRDTAASIPFELFDSISPAEPTPYRGVVTYVAHSSALDGLGQASVVINLLPTGGPVFAATLPATLRFSEWARFMCPMLPAGTFEVDLFVGHNRTPHPVDEPVRLSHGTVLTVCEVGHMHRHCPTQERLLRDPCRWKTSHHAETGITPTGFCLLYKSQRWFVESEPSSHEHLHEIAADTTGRIRSETRLEFASQPPVSDLCLHGRRCWGLAMLVDLPPPVVANTPQAAGFIVFLDFRPLGVRPFGWLQYSPSLHLPTVLTSLDKELPQGVEIEVVGKARNGYYVEVTAGEVLTFQAVPDSDYSLPDASAMSDHVSEDHSSSEVSSCADTPPQSPPSGSEESARSRSSRGARNAIDGGIGEMPTLDVLPSATDEIAAFESLQPAVRTAADINALATSLHVSPPDPSYADADAHRAGCMSVADFVITDCTFQIHIPRYRSITVKHRLRLPCMEQHVLEELVTASSDRLPPFFDRLVPTQPQLGRDFGSLLLLPTWHKLTGRCTVLFDLHHLGGPIFAQVVSGPVTHWQCRQIAERFSTGPWQLYVAGATRPHIGTDDFYVADGWVLQFRAGGTPPQWFASLAPRFSGPVHWPAEPSVPASASEDLILALHGDRHTIIEITASTEQSLAQRLADLVDRAQDSALFVCPLGSQLSDVCSGGCNCRGVVAIHPIRDNPERSGRLLFLDGRPANEGIMFTYTHDVDDPLLYAEWLGLRSPTLHHIVYARVPKTQHEEAPEGTVFIFGYLPNAARDDESASHTGSNSVPPDDSTGHPSDEADARHAPPHTTESNSDTGTDNTAGPIAVQCFTTGQWAFHGCSSQFAYTEALSCELFHLLGQDARLVWTTRRRFEVKPKAAVVDTISCQFHYARVVEDEFPSTKPRHTQAKLLSEPQGTTPAANQHIACLRTLTYSLGGRWLRDPAPGWIDEVIGPDSLDETSSAEEEGEIFTTVGCIILKDGYSAEVASILVRLPATTEETRKCVAAARRRDHSDAFPALLDVLPQPIPGNIVYLAGPPWASDQHGHCFNLTLLDGRLFTVHAPDYISRHELVLLARLSPDRQVDVYIGSDENPLIGEVPVHLFPGVLISFLPAGAELPPLPTLGEQLLSRSMWCAEPFVPGVDDPNACCIVDGNSHHLHFHDPQQPQRYREHIARAVGINLGFLNVHAARPAPPDVDLFGYKCHSVLATADISLSEGARHDTLALLDCRPIQRGWRTVCVPNQSVPFSSIFELLGRGVPRGRAVHIDTPIGQDGCVRLHSGKVIIVSFVRTDGDHQRPSAPGTGELASSASEYGGNDGSEAPEPPDRAGDRVISESGQPTDSAATTNGLVEVPFLIFAQDYWPELVLPRLSTACGQAEALETVAQIRQADAQRRSPRLVGVFPQPLSRQACLLALPRWAYAGVAVLIDNQVHPKGIFANIVLAKCTRADILTLAALPPEDAGLYVFVKDVPWAIPSDTEVYPAEGDLLTICNTLSAPAALDLRGLLYYSRHWDCNPTLPGDQLDVNWVLANGPCRAAAVPADAFAADSAATAEAIGLTSGSFTLIPSSPPVSDHAWRGQACHNVFLACETTDLQGRQSESGGLAPYTLNLRPILLYVTWGLAQSGRVDVLELCQRLTPRCPTDHHIRIYGGEAERATDNHFRAVRAGTVLRAEFQPNYLNVIVLPETERAYVFTPSARHDAPAPTIDDGPQASSSTPGGSTAVTTSTPILRGGTSRTCAGNHGIHLSKDSIRVPLEKTTYMCPETIRDENAIRNGTVSDTPVFRLFPSTTQQDLLDDCRPAHSTRPAVQRALGTVTSVAEHTLPALFALAVLYFALHCAADQRSRVWDPPILLAICSAGWPHSSRRPTRFLLVWGFACYAVGQAAAVQLPFQASIITNRADIELPTMKSVHHFPPARSHRPTPTPARSNRLPGHDLGLDWNDVHECEVNTLVTLLDESILQPESEVLYLSSTLVETLQEHFAEGVTSLSQRQSTQPSREVPIVRLAPHVGPRSFDLTGINMRIGCTLDHIAQLLHHAPCPLWPLPEQHSGVIAEWRCANPDLDAKLAVGECSAVIVYTDGSFDGLHSSWAFHATALFADGWHNLGWIGDRVQLGSDEPTFIGALSHGALEGELSALFWCLTWLLAFPAATEVTIYSDCTTAIGLTSGSIGQFRGHDIAHLCRAVMQALQAAKGPTPAALHHIRSHIGHLGNEVADRLAKLCCGPASSGRAWSSHPICTFVRRGWMPWLWLFLDANANPHEWPIQLADSFIDQPSTEIELPTRRECEQMLGLSAPVEPSSHKQWSIIDAVLLTVNVQSLHPKEVAPGQDSPAAPFHGRAALLREQFVEYGVCIAALQETRAPRNETIQSKTHIRFCSACDEQGSYGVELWFSRTVPFMQHPSAEIAFQVSDFVVVHWDPRILAVRFARACVRLLFVVIHAPTNSSPERNKWWHDFRGLVCRLKQDAQLILLGDFNLHLDRPHANRIGELTWHSPVPPPQIFYRLLEDADQWILFMLSSGPDGHLAVPRTPEGRAKLQQICLSLPQQPWDMDVHRHAAKIEEHFRTLLPVAFPTQRARQQKTYFTPVTWQLRNHRAWLRKRIHAASGFGQNFSLACAWRHLSALRHTSGQLRSAIRRDTKAYLHDIAVKATQDPTKDTVQRLRMLTGGPRRKQKGNRPLPAVEVSPGTLASTHREAKQKWIAHFSAIEDGHVQDPMEFVHGCYQRQQGKDLSDYSIDPTDIPSLHELESALRSASTDRAYGLDGIPGEVLHYGGPYIAKVVYQLLLKSAFRLCEPIQHKGGTLYFIWKHKGPKQCCSSYRGILVSSVIGKALHKTVRNRCAAPLANSTVPLQVGGLPQYPVTVPAHAARLFQSGCQSRRRSHAILFLDLQEAFYRIIRPLITGDHPSDSEVARICAAVQLPSGTMHELREFLGGPSLLRAAGSSAWADGAVAESLHDTWFRLPDEPEVVVTRTGSRPGDSLSDMVFSFLFAKVLQQVRGALERAELLAHIPWSPHMCNRIQPLDFDPPQQLGLSDATWMDDLSMFLMGEDAPSLTKALGFGTSSLIDACLQRALVPNLSKGKTEAIVQLHGKGAKSERRRIFGEDDGTLPLSCRLWQGAKLRVVPVYRHLGGFLQHNGGLRHEIAFRCAQAWDAFNKRRRKVFQSPLVSSADKAILFDSLISTVMFHGSGTWTRITQQHIDSLDAVLRQMACQMLIPAYSCEDAWHLGTALAIAKAGIPRAATYLHAFRLRYLLSCIRLEIPEIWALAHWEVEWLGLVRSSVQWMWEHTETSGDRPSDGPSWETWVSECRTSPRKWKSRVRRAILHAIHIERCQSDYDYHCGLLCKQLCLIGACPPTTSPRTDTRCEICVRYITEGTQCPHCLRHYATNVRVGSLKAPKEHLHCAPTLQASGPSQPALNGPINDEMERPSAELLECLSHIDYDSRAAEIPEEEFWERIRLSFSSVCLPMRRLHITLEVWDRSMQQGQHMHSLAVSNRVRDALLWLRSADLASWLIQESLCRLGQGLPLDFLETPDEACGFCLSIVGLCQISDTKSCPASVRARSSSSLHLAGDITRLALQLWSKGVRTCLTASKGAGIDIDILSQLKDIRSFEHAGLVTLWTGTVDEPALLFHQCN
ncbi:unnamed protein product [Symbiodinium sp. CCMP2456]|nr:unnamed protein product [Symbiodinium sp. CCMP2456]